MKKTVELPLIEPLYSTYHYQGTCTAIIRDNPSIRNWYLEEIMMLICSKKFLSDFSSPEVGIVDSGWNVSPYIERRWFNTQFFKGYVHGIIRNMIDAGYYVCFDGIDDYYVEGKSWYKKRHFTHDGTICGYDRENKTYCIYAYDSNWVYRKFNTPQKAFEAGRRASYNKGWFGNICAIRPKNVQVSFSPENCLKKIGEYLSHTIDKYPEETSELIYGIAVHNYIAKYLDRLYDSSIAYEKTDRRVLRLIWEHKKAMLERIKRLETELSLSSNASDAYSLIVKKADTMRMLYASHLMKRRDSLLPTIKNMLLSISEDEKQILTELLNCAGGYSK